MLSRCESAEELGATAVIQVLQDSRLLSLLRLLHVYRQSTDSPLRWVLSSRTRQGQDGRASAESWSRGTTAPARRGPKIGRFKVQRSPFNR
jgi:hypothetical protein